MLGIFVGGSHIQSLFVNLSSEAQSRGEIGEREGSKLGEPRDHIFQLGSIEVCDSWRTPISIATSNTLYLYCNFVCVYKGASPRTVLSNKI